MLSLFAAVTAPAAEPFHWGMNGHPLNQAAYMDVSLEAQFDLLAELGAGWYRCDVDAPVFQADPARFDALVRTAEKRKVKLLPILLPSPNCQSEEATPKQIHDTARAFAKDIVSRYKGRITHWELGNEYDTYALIRKGEVTQSGKRWTWDGDPDGNSPDDFDPGRCARVKAEIMGLYEGVKAADPAALTIVNTAGWLHYGFIDRLVRENPTVPFDILSWHWYSEMGDMTAVQGRLNLVERLHRYGKPLWITEVNRRDGSKGAKEAEASAYMSGEIARLAANPGIDGLFIYELLDEPYFGPDGESDYGLVTLKQDHDGRWQIARRKKAFAAYQAMIRAGGRSGR
ncbi:MAG TPA: glycosyl hydrolase [Opitutaceae bacterium]|nr:glycosyl hydrolase [Opitutaceae bacterium]